MAKEVQKIDYAGRTVDLLLLKTILEVPVANQRVYPDVSNAVGEPMIVAGIEKMVQRYALALINAMGSTKFRPGHGTNLVPKAATGRIYSLQTLEAAAAESNLLARSQIAAADANEETPDDERLVQSEVTGLEFSRERAMVRISVRLTTAAGESYTYIIPVPVGVG